MKYFTTNKIKACNQSISLVYLWLKYCLLYCSYVAFKFLNMCFTVTLLSSISGVCVPVNSQKTLNF